MLLATAEPTSFAVGALYSRRDDIHARFGGQRQGGISTPASEPFVFIFTGEAGKQHGYDDFWDDSGVFHYYGEGQRGDMALTAGNQAVLRHEVDRKRLLLFQMMGKSQPYRYLGEFRCLAYYEVPNVPDTEGVMRTAIAFRLVPLVRDLNVGSEIAAVQPATNLRDTTSNRDVPVRTKQWLFKRRLLTVEKECRLTGIRDLRFLCASHIRPWAQCETGDQRVDGNNGLLLSPTADLLFDRGWITFDPEGSLITSTQLPLPVLSRAGLNLRSGRACGPLNPKQAHYMAFHRETVFERRFEKLPAPEQELVDHFAGSTDGPTQAQSDQR